MDAQNKLVEAKGQYINALYSYNKHKSSLEKAMGVKVELDVEPYRQALEEKNVKGDKK
jgi:outer membrane protein TolC